MNPLKEKKARENKTGVSLKPYKTARARTRGEKPVGRYREASAAADELISILGGNPARDHATWAFYCYHHDIGILLDRAHELASLAKQGEVRNPVTAFQRWLQKSFPKEAL